jgi:hypothetical protein
LEEYRLAHDRTTKIQARKAATFRGIGVATTTKPNKAKVKRWSFATLQKNIAISAA